MSELEPKERDENDVAGEDDEIEGQRWSMGRDVEPADEPHEREDDDEN